MEIAGTSAIVTGGASGLGAATSRLLAEHGVTVVIADLQADKGELLAKEIDGSFVHVDVGNTNQIIEAIEAASGRAPLWSLVNCAGVGWAARTIGKDGQYESAHDLDLFRKVLEINLVGTFNCLRLAATVMSRNDPDEDGLRGAVVNTSSVASTEGQIGQAAYAASKGGINSLTLVAARDLSAVGVRVNTILPGLVDTPIYGTGPESDAFKERLGTGVLFPKRLGRPQEYASMAVELLRNSYMNGECVRVDAGIRMQPK
jgi:NAD(P)-dependent dehydrogenase (short-subunit alcohol dehydrogenase family)